jgi:Ca2+-binding RTX toxin-like protein
VNGGAGFDTLRYGDFSSLTKAVMINELGTTTINLNNGTSISNIEWFYSFKTGSGNDIVSLTEHLDNNINTGSGDDTVNAGGGYNVVDGGAGNDLLIVDYSSNTYTGENAGIVSSPGYFKAFYDSNSNYDYVQHSNIERFQITGTLVADYIVTDSGNDTINSRAGDDYISSGAGNDYLNGEAGNDELYGGNNNDTLQGTNSGTGEYDYLEGGTGNDRFILADTTKTFYDDGNTTNAGTSDYATIADFNTTDDTIQLRGASSDYLLTVSGSNTNLHINKPGSEPDELIAVINNQTALSLTASYFSYVASPTLPSITLAVSPSSVTEDGTANLVYTFTRSGVTTNPLTVNYTLGGTATLNTDYTRTGTNNTVTFAAGSSTATVTVDPTADTTVESDETVDLLQKSYSAT